MEKARVRCQTAREDDVCDRRKTMYVTVGIQDEQPNELDQNAYATISDSESSDFEED